MIRTESADGLEAERNRLIVRKELEVKPQQSNPACWIALALIIGTFLLIAAVIAVPQLLIPVGALFVVCLVVVGVGLSRAPEGYEDPDGFHYGKQKGE